MNVRVDAVGLGTSLADRKRRAGQRLVLGFEAPFLTGDLRRLIREVRPGGYVFRRRNVLEPEQIRELLRELRDLADPHDPPVMFVDQEGGRVLAVGAPATQWPSMRALGRVGGDRVHAVGRALGSEMRALGFDGVFGPVADVDRDGSAIGDRSFGSDPDQVAASVGAFVEGLHEAGLIACLKHFPGHGAAPGDSHERLPVAEREARELREVDLVPFERGIARGVGCLMTAHVVYPEWDEEWPASLSTRVVPRILRETLSFDGLVVADDLDMRAVRRWAPDEIAARGTDGAFDVGIVTDDELRQVALFEAFVREQEAHPTRDRAASRAVKRLDGLRDRFFHSRPVAPPVTIVGTNAHLRLAAEVADRGGD